MSFVTNIDGAFARAMGDCCKSICISGSILPVAWTRKGTPALPGTFSVRMKPGTEQTGGWIPSNVTIPGSGFSVAFGSNRNILAVGDPEAAVVRLYEKVGFEWVRWSLLVASVQYQHRYR